MLGDKSMTFIAFIIFAIITTSRAAEQLDDWEYGGAIVSNGFCDGCAAGMWAMASNCESLVPLLAISFTRDIFSHRNQRVMDCNVFEELSTGTKSISSEIALVRRTSPLETGR